MRVPRARSEVGEELRPGWTLGLLAHMCMGRRVRQTALAWIALVASVLACHAEEPTQRQSEFADLSRNFSAPSDSHAFRFVARVLVNGVTQSFSVFEAEVVQDEGERAWRVSDRMLTPDGREMRYSIATLDARLRPLHGRLGGVGMGSSEGMELRWRRVDDEIRVVGGPIGKPSEERHARVLTHRGPLVFNNATDILLARLAPATVKSLNFAVPLLEVGSPQGDVIADVVWRLDHSAEYEGKPATTVEVSAEGRKTRITLTRDLTQFLSMDPGFGGEVRILPLRTLRQAAEEMLIALETGDTRMLYDAVHWASVAETVQVPLPPHVPKGTTPPVEVARDAVIERFRERFPPGDGPENLRSDGGEEDVVVIREEAGRTKAALKTSRGTFAVILAKRQGNGYVVQLPEILAANDSAK